jgi:hypothetical protein
MQKFSIILFLTLIMLTDALSKPVLTKTNYLISSLSDNGGGLVTIGTGGTYQLIYATGRTADDAVASDFWMIRNLTADQYTFQNAATGKYIRHDITATNDRAALVMVDNLMDDNSTSFTLEHKETNGISYYIIRSVVSTSKLWNRRVSLSDMVYPVGVYSGSGSSNELFVFFDSEGEAVSDDGKVITPPTPNSRLGVFAPYLHAFTINEKSPVPDTAKKEFYVALPDDGLPTSTLQLTIQYEPVVSSHKLFLNGSEVINGTSVRMNPVSGASSQNLELRNGTTVIESAKLYFTSLPIVQIYSEGSIGNVYSLARIAVNEPLKPGESEVLNTKIRNRGGISIGYPKKNFAINLQDSLALDKTDRSFFGLRSDNNWILDAMYIDPGRMRNRVSTDLWNDFARKPYWADREPEMINGTRGRFVEVFLNDAYQGLYCMTEKVDRQQLKLKKLRVGVDLNTGANIYTQRGAIYKATSWSTAVMYGYPFQGNNTIPGFNNQSISWSAYECKYPELDEGEPISWDNLQRAMKVSSSYYITDALFKSLAQEIFDLPVYLDYYLFLELLLATDNHGKNLYTNIYDQTESAKVSVTPWDLDGTWGIRWDGGKSITAANQDFDTFVRSYEHGQLNLFLRMKSTDTDNWSTYRLRQRYGELRGLYFAHEQLVARFQRYADQFIRSGAAARESARWGAKDFVGEVNFLNSWIETRLSYMDNKYLGGPYSSLQTPQSSLRIYPTPAVDQLYVAGLQPGTEVQLYNLQGVLLQRVTSTSEVVQLNVSEFAPGVYLVKAGGRSEKVIIN